MEEVMPIAGLIGALIAPPRRWQCRTKPVKVPQLPTITLRLTVINCAHIKPKTGNIKLE